jgi:OPA family glycerol-3-phosphate transporter-like MFS transporter
MTPNAPKSASSLRFSQIVTVLLLFGGYAALYFCRADLSVATPYIIDELGANGIAHADAVIRIGQMTSAGVLAYALGKLFLTGLGDFWGGRLNFLIGLVGATLFTYVFTTGSALSLFTFAWFCNRLTQSIAWAGLIKVTSKWFDYTSHGAIAGILSVSYLVGDALARHWMGGILGQGFAWRSVFYFAAAVGGLLLVSNLLFLRESRTDAGYPPAKAHPANLFGGTESRPESVRALLGPLLRNRAFLIVCLLSFGATIVRETFNIWTPTYLHEHAGYTESAAAGMSAVFPAVGVFSVLLSGWLSDRLGEGGRATVMFFGFLTSGVVLLALTVLQPTTSGSTLAVAMIGAVAFCVLGPYSYLGGAYALDFGGKQAGAASSGLIDGIGYLGGILAGDTVARISVGFGWKGVFVALAVVCVLAAASSAYLYFWNTSSLAREHLERAG